MRAATELVETGRYPKRTEPYYFRAPGYPYFLAAATLGHPRSVVAGKAINAVLGALGVVVLAALSARIFRRRSVAVATGAAAALHPGLVMLSTDVQSEPLFVLLLLCSGYLLLAAADRPSSNLAIAAGIGLALAALTRPSALALAPLLAAPLLDRRWPWRARGQVAASALLGVLLTLMPWTLRNALVFRELVPINDAAGSAFYQGNSDWMIRFYDVDSLPEYRAWLGAAFADLERQTRSVDEASGGSPAALSRHFVRRTFEERRGDPRGWARLLARKAWDWLRPYPSPLFWPPWVLVARRHGQHARRGPRGSRTRPSAGRRARLRLDLPRRHHARARPLHRRLALSDGLLGSGPPPLRGPGRVTDADDRARAAFRPHAGPLAREPARPGLAARHPPAASASALASPPHGLGFRLRERGARDGGLPRPAGASERRAARSRRRLWSRRDGRGVPPEAPGGRPVRGLRRPRGVDPLVPEALGRGSAPVLRYRSDRLALRRGVRRRSAGRELPVSGRRRLGRPRSGQVRLYASDRRGRSPLPRRDAPGASTRPASGRDGVPLRGGEPREWRRSSPTQPGMACG